MREKQFGLTDLPLFQTQQHLDVGQLHIQITPFEKVVALLRQGQQALGLIRLTNHHIGQCTDNQHRHLKKGRVLAQLHFDAPRQGNAGLQVIFLQGDNRLDRQGRQQLVAQRSADLGLAPTLKQLIKHAVGFDQTQFSRTGPDIRQHQHRKALGNLIRHMLTPFVDQVELTTVDQLQAATIDQCREHFRVFGQAGMFDGQVLHMVIGEPQAGIEMQLFEAFRVALFQATAQKLGKQIVEAVPLTLAVQWQEEQLHGLQLFQQMLAVMPTSQRIGQVATELLCHPEGQQQLLLIGGQLLKHTAQQVRAYRCLIGAHIGNLCCGLRLMTQPETGQMHAHHPAFGLAVQRRKRHRVQLQATALQVIAGFRLAQAQLLLADLHQQVLGAQGGQVKRRLRAGADGQGKALGGEFDQAVEGTKQLGILNQMQVIKHQQQRSVQLRQVHQQAFHDRGNRHPHGVLQIGQGFTAKTRQQARQRFDQLQQKTRRFIVAWAKRQPGHGLTALRPRLGQRNQGAGFAKACRSGQ